MGDLTRTQLEAALKFRVGNRSDVTTQLTDAVKFAHDELITSLRVPETQETAALLTTTGISTYPAPSDMFAIVSLRNDTDRERLYPLSIRQLDKQHTSTTGKPTHYAWWRNEIIFFPTPDSTQRAILMRFIKRLPSLSVAGSVSSLPREWDEVIIQGGYFRLLGWIGLKQEAQLEEVVYNRMIQRRMDRIVQSGFDLEDTAKPQLVERTSPRAD